MWAESSERPRSDETLKNCYLCSLKFVKMVLVYNMPWSHLRFNNIHKKNIRNVIKNQNAKSLDIWC